MTGVGYVSGLILAAVFTWAGAAKLRDRPATIRTFVALGLPASSGAATALPASELAIAAALVTVPWVGGFAAVVMLAAFSAFLGARLADGTTASCGCFGSSGHQPISFVELVRNAALMVLAVLALGADSPVRPGVDEVVVATTTAAIGALVVALAAVKRDLGSVWRTKLAGEEGR